MSDPVAAATLAVWREVGRLLEVERVLAAILPPLAAVAPVSGIVLEAPDAPRIVVGTVDPTASLRGEVPGVAGAVLHLGIPLDHPLGAPLVRALGEPVAVSFANTRRLREADRLRTEAEAERAALLARLHRREVAGPLVGADGGLRNVLRRVDQVAATDAPVFVSGETGSGKEVVARAIHARSPRAGGPFLRVNCGAIPLELVDSELFGHERGAFTGAIAARPGWFERADGGTLFLDEIAELPPAAQVRLLRVLQDGTYQRVGGEQERRTDVRILAATHRDVEAMVRDGSFRADLWYRVSVFPIRIPPLRDRPEDLPALATRFAAESGARLFGRALVPTEDDLQRLGAWHWPGNVRELAAVIERAAILGDGRRLELRGALGEGPLEPQVAAGVLEAANRRVIVEALERTHGRIEGPRGAAAALGINPFTLRSRMRKLGIRWSDYRPSR